MPTRAPAAANGSAPLRLITFSMCRKTPTYVNGAVANAELIHTVFPGWTARYYLDTATVPAWAQAKLRAAGAQIVPIDMARYGNQSMFWRFWAAADPTAERFISRDVDSRLMARDYEAVRRWIESGRKFHVVRDHPSHSLYPMSGGLWGAVRGALPQVMELIRDFPVDSGYLTDMNFLNSRVWPLAMHDCLQHDGYSCADFGADPFPVARDTEKGYHVGQVFDADGVPRPDDVQSLLATAQPPECAPGAPPSPRAFTTPAEVAAECRRLKRTHRVVPGVGWGTLPSNLQTRWKRLACDAVVNIPARWR